MESHRAGLTDNAISSEQNKNENIILISTCKLRKCCDGDQNDFETAQSTSEFPK